MHRGVEVLQAFGAVGQFGDAEQCRLQAFATLALQHLLLQQAIGVAQRIGALGHAAFELRMHEAAFQGRLDMLGHIRQQRLIALGITRGFGITLHNDTTDSLAAAQQRHPEPVHAIRAESRQRSANPGLDLGQRPAHRGTVLEQIPGEAVLAFLHRKFALRIGRIPIGNVGVIGETKAFACRVVQDNIEILGIHQAGDDRVQTAENFWHLAVGAGLIGNREQGPLQAFGLLEAGHRLAQILQCAHFVQTHLQE